MKNLPNKNGALRTAKASDKKEPFSLKPAKGTRMRKAISNAKPKAKVPSLKEQFLASHKDQLTVWRDAQEIMEEFNIRPRTLTNWRKQKKIPFSKQGRKIFYNRTLFEKMLMKNIIVEE